MSDDTIKVASDSAEPTASARKPLSDAAKRALAEAEARRAAQSEEARPKEFLGREGPEPTRFGDWEHKGIISDF